jgi:hypothetical protein
MIAFSSGMIFNFLPIILVFFNDYFGQFTGITGNQFTGIANPT